MLNNSMCSALSLMQRRKKSSELAMVLFLLSFPNSSPPFLSLLKSNSSFENSIRQPIHNPSHDLIRVGVFVSTHSAL